MRFDRYLEAVRRDRGDSERDSNVAVIVAAGEILIGDQPPGTIGSDSLAKLVRQARHDDTVKAVVLRVDSPGGSTFGSEIIVQELDELRAAGKPLVASMSSVAASGGYWISMRADEIWAEPTTLTGSIGILAMFPTFQRSLDKLGVHVDGVGTTRLSGQFRPDRELGEEAREILQLSIDHGYRRFITEVADARGQESEDIDAVARGRVWTGATALEKQLVDELGGLDKAVESAARLADLGEDYGIKYIEKELSLKESLLLIVAAKTRALLGRGATGAGTPPMMQAVEDLVGRLQRLARFNDPRGIYSYCFCDLR